MILAGGGLGNAVLFSIGAALRAAGSRVLYFAGYKKIIDRYKVAEIEAAADVVVWCCDEAPGFQPTRPQDRTFVGNIVQAMLAYAAGELGEQPIPFVAADRIIAIGSDRMMAAVGAARHGVLAPHLKPHHFAIASINSPMQCMMKEICAQCLQPHVDPRQRASAAMCSPASTRTSRSIASISPAWPRGWYRTRCRKSSPRSGSTAAWCISSGVPQRPEHLFQRRTQKHGELGTSNRQFPCLVPDPVLSL